jgi:tetratricopeptide (TPR) repeat protein
MRLYPLTVSLLLVPCLHPLLAAEPALEQPAQTPKTPAYRSWQEGQKALEGEQFDQAIGQFQLSLRLDPGFVQAHLSLAAAYLALGEDNRALPHLERYVRARPHHLTVRAHFAELLFRVDRIAEARNQFEQFVVDIQDQPRLAEEHLVHSHLRLMEIAEKQGDDYSRHLHRGIGLYHLARYGGKQRDREAARLTESLLCKAAAELTLAQRQCPDAARPCWYLHAVWVLLGQQQPARRWLRRLEDNLAPDDLTPVERRDLQLAWYRLEQDNCRK